jgi:transcriptional regulator with XRE-family HTH domain
MRLGSERQVSVIIGERLRTLRKQKNFSQGDIEKRGDLNTQF